jgi:lysophospholipase L1-like esterase
MKEVVISLRPDMVLIFFGANDAVVAGGSTYVSLNEYQNNIEQMVIAIGKVIEDDFRLSLFVVAMSSHPIMISIRIYADTTSCSNFAHHSTPYRRGGPSEI